MAIKTGVWIIVGIIVLVVVLGFFVFSGGNEEKTSSGSTSGSNGVGGGQANVGSDEEVAWLDFELKDVSTGESFKISDFVGKPILLESFAVWCPTCTAQQNKLKELHEEVGDSVVSISLDTDPNEDEERIRTHIESNGFNWYYAISPIEVTQALIDEFGNSIVSAPTAPMVLICEDGSFRKLGGFGVRSVDKLKEEIANGC